MKPSIHSRVKSKRWSVGDGDLGGAWGGGRGAKPTSSTSGVGSKASLVWKKEAEVVEGFGQGRIEVVFIVDEEEISISRRERFRRFHDASARER